MNYKEIKKQELENKTVEELRKICKKNNISYYENGKRLTKGPMLERILSNLSDKRDTYIEQANIGEIVAFKFPSGKVISAKITKKSSSNRKFFVETQYGAGYKIDFDDVIWVKTNKRWPKTIIRLLKGDIKLEVPKDGEDVG